MMNNCFRLFVLASLATGCGSQNGEEATASQEQAATCGACNFQEWAFNTQPSGTYAETALTIPAGYGPSGQPTQYTHLCALEGIVGTFSATPAPNGTFQSAGVNFWPNNNWVVDIQNGGGRPPGTITQVEVGCVPLGTFHFSGPHFTQGDFLFSVNPGQSYALWSYFTGFISINEVFGSLTTPNDYFYNSPGSGNTWSGLASNDASHREATDFASEGLSWAGNPTLTFSGPYQVDSSTHSVNMPGPQLAFCALTDVQGPFGSSVGQGYVYMSVTNNGFGMTLQNRSDDPNVAAPHAQAYCVNYQ